jgi:DNA polymerase-3 subunit beta
VTCELEKDIVAITCQTSSFTVRTLPPDDFPRFPEVQTDQRVIVSTEAFTSVVSHVSKAVSRDETRPILTGVLVVIDGPELKMAATDSYRLAVKQTILEQPPGAETEVVVPGKALDEVARLGQGEESITFGVSENQVIFDVGPTTFVTRRIEGSFPNYRQLIPADVETRVTVPREELIQAVRRVSLLAQHNSPLRLAVEAEDKTVTLSATTQDVGDASEGLMAEIDGPDVEIAFNHTFLADGLMAAEGEVVTIEIVSPLKPGVLKAAGDDGFLYLLMPVRLG